MWKRKVTLKGVFHNQGMLQRTLWDKKSWPCLRYLKRRFLLLGDIFLNCKNLLEKLTILFNIINFDNNFTVYFFIEFNKALNGMTLKLREVQTSNNFSRFLKNSTVVFCIYCFESSSSIISSMTLQKFSSRNWKFLYYLEYNTRIHHMSNYWIWWNLLIHWKICSISKNFLEILKLKL